MLLGTNFVLLPNKRNLTHPEIHIYRGIEGLVGSPCGTALAWRLGPLWWLGRALCAVLGLDRAEWVMRPHQVSQTAVATVDGLGRFGLTTNRGVQQSAGIQTDAVMLVLINIYMMETVCFLEILYMIQ